MCVYPLECLGLMSRPASPIRGSSLAIHSAEMRRDYSPESPHAGVALLPRLGRPLSAADGDGAVWVRGDAGLSRGQLVPLRHPLRSLPLAGRPVGRVSTAEWSECDLRGRAGEKECQLFRQEQQPISCLALSRPGARGHQGVPPLLSLPGVSLGPMLPPSRPFLWPSRREQNQIPIRC